MKLIAQFKFILESRIRIPENNIYIITDFTSNLRTPVVPGSLAQLGSYEESGNPSRLSTLRSQC